jgi:hypothetical protein
MTTVAVAFAWGVPVVFVIAVLRFDGLIHLTRGYCGIHSNPEHLRIVSNYCLPLPVGFSSYVCVAF